jgi:hypothetical protein
MSAADVVAALAYAKDSGRQVGDKVRVAYDPEGRFYSWMGRV